MVEIDPYSPFCDNATQYQWAEHNTHKEHNSSIQVTTLVFCFGLWLHHTQFHRLALKLEFRTEYYTENYCMYFIEYEWSTIISWPPFLEKKKADDNILSIFDSEKYVLKSHNESWIDKHSDGST